MQGSESSSDPESAHYDFNKPIEISDYIQVVKLTLKEVIGFDKYFEPTVNIIRRKEFLPV